MATSSTNTPNIKTRTGWATGEDEWGDPMNVNFRIIDALMNLILESLVLLTPPASPVPGARYAIPATGTPTGVWAGQSGKIAYWSGTGWLYFAPLKGWRAAIFDTTLRMIYFDGTAWTDEPGPGSLTAVNSRLTALETWKADTTTTLNTQASAIAAIQDSITTVNTQLSAFSQALTDLQLIAPVTLASNVIVQPSLMGKWCFINSASLIKVSIMKAISDTIPVGAHTLFRHQNPGGRVVFDIEAGYTLRLPYGGSAESAGAGATIGLYKSSISTWELSGQVKYQEGIAAGERVVIVPNSSGSNISVSNQCRRLILNGLGAITSLSLAMPTDPVDGQVFRLTTATALSGLTLSAPTGVTVKNPITSLPAGGVVAFQYYATDKVWFNY